MRGSCIHCQVSYETKNPLESTDKRASRKKKKAKIIIIGAKEENQVDRDDYRGIHMAKKPYAMAHGVQELRKDSARVRVFCLRCSYIG